MKVFILVGLQLSGKSSHGHRMVKEEDSCRMIETGHAVYYELNRQGLQVNHVNTTKVIKELLSREPTAFTSAIIDFEKEKYKDAKILLLNGVKSPAEIDYAKTHFGAENVFVLGFHANQETRFNRVNNPDRFEVSGKLQGKKQEDKDLALWENFISRDIREIGLGIGTALALCSEIIVTEDILWPFHSFERSYTIFREIIKP